MKRVDLIALLESMDAEEVFIGDMVADFEVSEDEEGFIHIGDW